MTLAKQRHAHPRRTALELLAERAWKAATDPELNPLDGIIVTGKAAPMPESDGPVVYHCKGGLIHANRHTQAIVVGSARGWEHFKLIADEASRHAPLFDRHVTGHFVTEYGPIGGIFNAAREALHHGLTFGVSEAEFPEGDDGVAYCLARGDQPVSLWEGLAATLGVMLHYYRARYDTLDKEDQKIVGYLIKSGGASRRDIARECYDADMSCGDGDPDLQGSAKARLDRLKREGVIVVTGKGRGASYCIAPAYM